MKKSVVFGVMFFLGLNIFAKSGTGVGIPNNAVRLDKAEKTYEEVFKTGKDFIGINKSSHKGYVNILKRSKIDYCEYKDYKRSKDTVKFAKHKI